MNQNERLDSDIRIIMLDFAENDQYILQDEIQLFHWNNSQCSIYPAVIIIKMDQMSFQRSHLVLYEKI